jgi:hypothetical protein
VQGWYIPVSLRVESGLLLYDPPDSVMSERKFERKTKETKESSDLLEKFLRLATSTDDQAILDYADCWGPLGLCVHWLPSSHGDLIDLSWASERREQQGLPPSPFLALIPKKQKLRPSKRKFAPHCDPLVIDGEWAESLEAWRWYAQTARRLLGKSADLSRHQQKQGRRHGWQEVAFWLNDWLSLAPIQAHCMAVNDGLMVGLRSQYSRTALSAVLASHAMFAASRSRSLSTCSNCGALHLPSVRIPSGKRTYCPRCRAAARRDAAADFRERNPDYFKKFRAKYRAKDYARRGLGISEIASRLQVSRECVEEWVSASGDRKSKG